MVLTCWRSFVIVYCFHFFEEPCIVEVACMGICDKLLESASKMICIAIVSIFLLPYPSKKIELEKKTHRQVSRSLRRSLISIVLMRSRRNTVGRARMSIGNSTGMSITSSNGKGTKEATMWSKEHADKRWADDSEASVRNVLLLDNRLFNKMQCDLVT